MIERNLIVGVQYLETRKRMNAFGFEEYEADSNDEKLIQTFINQKRDLKYFDKFGNLFSIDEIIQA